MKAIIITALIFAGISTSAKVSKTKKYKAKKIHQTQLKKNMKFGDHNVGGQFMFSQEAISTVENEKSLSDLLALRTHFNDRQEDLSKRY